MRPSVPPAPTAGHADLQRHYRKDAAVYDLNRRFFLFGRGRLIRVLARTIARPRRVLEIGCGTGVNLLGLERAFPGARILGVDLSRDMLAVARRRLRRHRSSVALRHGAFDRDSAPTLGRFDLVLCSYVLSTVGALDETVALVAGALSARGHLAIVDFHSTRSSLFQRWISHSIPIRTTFPFPAIAGHFGLRHLEVSSAYLGVWKYFTYVGERR